MSLCQWILGYIPKPHLKVINSRWGKSVYSLVEGHLRYHKLPEHYKEADALLSAVTALYTETLGPQLLLSTVLSHTQDAEILRGPHALNFDHATRLRFSFVLLAFWSSLRKLQTDHLKKMYSRRQGFLPSLWDHTICDEQDKTKNRSKQNPHFWHEESQAWRISATWEFSSVKYCIMIT